MKKYDNSMVLVISDTHHPYHHPDTIPFLKAVAKKYSPDRVIHIGDEVDAHALSVHEKNPDLYSAGYELEKAIETLQELYALFPRMDVLESNHGSRAFRTASAVGIPKKYLRQYKEVLEAPDGWKWHKDLTITVPSERRVYFRHHMHSDIARAAREYGMCVVQGHLHTKAMIEYVSTPAALLWGMIVGCSIDKYSPAFDYAAGNLKRPVISHGLIENGFAKLLPMPLSKTSRWTGVTP